MPIDLKRQILELFPFYQRLSNTFQDKLLVVAELAELPTGVYYFQEGHSCSRIALVGQGDVRVFKRGASGREITLYHVEGGETCILTASCVLAQTAYPATAIVDRPTQAVIFPADTFRDWVASNEVIRQFVFASLAERMEGVLSLIEEITFRKMDERLISFIKDKFKAQSGKPEIHMTHEEIALELGSAREVVSRILKEFERRGFIEQRRGVILPTTSGLNAISFR